MKGLLVLATLTFFNTYPVLASQQPDAIKLKIKQPQILEQQLEEYQRQRGEQIRQSNRDDIQESLNRTSANKALWQNVLNEIRDRQIRIEQDRKTRLPILPTR